MDLVTNGSVTWSTLPTRFERYHFPDFSIAQPAGRDAWMEELTQRWPAERDAIAIYFAHIDIAFDWFASRFLPWRSVSRSDRYGTPPDVDRLVRSTTNEAVDLVGVRGGGPG